MDQHGSGWTSRVGWTSWRGGRGAVEPRGVVDPRRRGWRSDGCDATRDAQAGGDGREDGDGRLDDKLPGLFLVC